MHTSSIYAYICIYVLKGRARVLCLCLVLRGAYPA